MMKKESTHLQVSNLIFKFMCEKFQTLLNNPDRNTEYYIILGICHDIGHCYDLLSTLSFLMCQYSGVTSINL